MRLFGLIPVVALSALALSIMLSACSRSAADAIDQAAYCEIHDVADMTARNKCTPGQKIIFLPPTFGNEQLPILFAAANCDLRYEVVQTVGGVVCIFAPLKEFD
jgi:hypothetical protein